ncbi:MAG TPA: outer membrane protein assembly factor BamD [Thermoanaerobaculia bacterium]|nr:outer membrane protein assembly factor BamD [Thermoanaerobaculia bacterium]
MRTHRILPIIMIMIALGLPACRGTKTRSTPAIDPELVNLSKQEAFDKAEALFEDKRWVRSRTFYQYVNENFPNDPLGRRSLLRIADTYFKQGSDVNLVESQYKYRDFINRYPGSESADYAMLQIANVSYKQMERPDRDQTKTREAVTKFQEMLTAFPRSSHRAEAETRLRKANDRLAKHEHLVARFYIKRKSYEAAILRLNHMVERFPDYEERDATFYDLGTALSALGRKGEARLYFERVVAEFPNSEFAAKAKQKLEQKAV